MDGLTILFLLFVAIIIALGVVFGSIVNLLVRKFPNLEDVFFADDVDRDGNPL